MSNGFYSFLFRMSKGLKRLDIKLAKNFASAAGCKKSSSVGESHPHALPDPDVNLSAHPAPIDQPEEARPIASERTVQAAGA